MRPFQAPCSAPSARRVRRPAKEPDPLRVKGLPEMNRTRIASYLALLSALFLFAGTLTLRGRPGLNSPGPNRFQFHQEIFRSPNRRSAAKPAPASTPAAKPAPASTPAASTPAASKPAATQQTRPANSTGIGLGQYGFRHLSQARHALLRQRPSKANTCRKPTPSRPAIACREELVPLATLRFSQENSKGIFDE